MAYLLLAGNIPQNKSGVGCRGYQVFRRRRVVRVVWGPVEFVRCQTVRLVWERTTMHQEYRCGSEWDAADLVRKIIEERLADGYERLGPGNRIDRTSRSKRSTRRRPNQR